jgi:hypothetical protein
MQELDFENKLSSWFRFRKQLETSKTPFKDVINYYNATEKCNLSVDPWDQKTWPQGPWELLTQNKLCDLTHSLGVCYTLQLTDRFSQSNFEIHISTDRTSEELFYPVFVDNNVLCYEFDEVCQRANLPDEFVSQRIYRMPRLP